MKIHPIVISADNNLILLSYGKKTLGNIITKDGDPSWIGTTDVIQLSGEQPLGDLSHIKITPTTYGVIGEAEHNMIGIALVSCISPELKMPDSAMVLQFLIGCGKISTKQAGKIISCLNEEYSNGSILCGIGWESSNVKVGNEQERYGQIDVTLRIRHNRWGDIGWNDFLFYTNGNLTILPLENVMSYEEERTFIL